MALPAAVQAQEDAANQFFEGVDGGEQPQATAIPQEGTHQQPVNTPESDSEIAKLKHKLDVLQGKYSAEVPRYAEQIKLLQQERDQLKAQMEQQTSVKGRSEVVAAMAETLGIDEDDAERFFDAVRQEAQREVKPLAEKVEETTRSYQERMESAAQVARQSCNTQIDGLCPQWRRLNDDANFIKFIDNTARDGKTLKQLLNERYQAMDAHGVAAIFNEFLGVANPLMTEVMPGRGGGGQADYQQNRQPTLEEIEAHYAAVRRGEISDDDNLIFEQRLYGN